MKLTNLSDGMSLFNTACLFEDLGDYQEALRTFRKAIDAGYRNLRRMNDFLTDEKSGVLALQGTAEYEEVKQLVEKIRAEATGHG
jgi:tetratricopeptide (TPR) repeat protein